MLAMVMKCGARPPRPGFADREILLVRAHRGADHLGRQVQERRVHVAQHRRRPFGQAGDFVQQALVLDQFQVAREAQGLAAFEDARLALLDVQHDEVVVQALARIRRSRAP
jgi:hypothetical protein